MWEFGRITIPPSSATAKIQAAFKPAGAPWRRPVNLAATNRGLPARPQVAFDQRGNAIVAWAGGASSAIKAAFRPAGGSWRRPVIVSGSGLLGWSFAMSRNGNAVIVWTDYRSSAFVQAAFRSGGAWRQPVTIAPVSILAAVVAMDQNGNALAVWTDPGGIMQAASKPAHGPWQKPVTLEPQDGCTTCVPTFPELAFDSRCNATAIWARTFGARDSTIEAATFTPDPVGP